MKLMRYIVAAVALLSLGTASAQRIESFNEALRQPTLDGSKVDVVERGDARQAVEIADLKRTSSKINGYRVGVFFDNGQSARMLSANVKSEFAEEFPNIPVYMYYENPYFKVAAGNCATQEEAVVLLERIRAKFPKAFILREQIDIHNL